MDSSLDPTMTLTRSERPAMSTREEMTAANSGLRSKLK